MSFFRDSFVRIYLPMARAQLKGRWKTDKGFRVECDSFVAEVMLAHIPAPTAFGGEKTVFVCPRCQSHVYVVGCAPHVGWGCPRCMRWRGRNRRRASIDSLMDKGDNPASIMNDPSDGDSPGNFIKITSRRGRCRICDFHYSKDDPDEARQHRSYHRRYLQACDDLSAPIHRAEREQMMKEGGEMLKYGEDFPERVRGAEHQMEALFHEHLAAVLGGSEPRRSFSEFLTDLDISGGLDSRYEKDVADELRRLHSGSAEEVTGPSRALAEVDDSRAAAGTTGAA